MLRRFMSLTAVETPKTEEQPGHIAHAIGVSLPNSKHTHNGLALGAGMDASGPGGPLSSRFMCLFSALLPSHKLITRAL